MWSLLVNNEFSAGCGLLSRSRSRCIRAMFGLTCSRPSRCWHRPRPEALLDIDDATAEENLAHVSVMAMSFVAQAARGLGQPMVPEPRSTRRGRSSNGSWSGGAASPTKQVQAVDAWRGLPPSTE